ncbi:hypothetical protein GCM10010211_20380 [Streptomyces albospinus]|uniref:Uncharacterized protein n=1 Tax=Streptomyces albospinus TaxID=285515 RepID=A0ABQ2UVD8_9ACTN|nr:hypothetical protein [Streptomyces albospinus]GGU55545.1 hypothetical protein GCM10010211_20380 [Streptomyces albospinus]
MPLPMVRLAIGRTNGTAHYGVLLNGAQPLTACATRSPDLQPIGENTAHTLCQSCTRVWLILTTAPHPSGEPDSRPAAGAGKSAAAHRPIPGHLLGYCGKPLDDRASTARRVCANCTGLSTALDRFHHTADELVLPSGTPCHVDDSVLWVASGRGNLVTGHRRDPLVGTSWCAQQLSGPNTDASHECAACRRIWQEAEVTRQTYTLPRARERARWWHQRQERDLDVFDDRADALQVGDAYSLSDCAETHHVVAAADRIRASHRDLVVYLPTDDRIADVRVHRDRLVAIQRPSYVAAVMPQPTPPVP